MALQVDNHCFQDQKMGDDRIENLFSLVYQKDWDTLLIRIAELEDPKVLCNMFWRHGDVRIDDVGTLLHLVCSSDAVNKAVVQVILDEAGSELVLLQDSFGHTPLHNAFRSGAPLEVIQLLTMGTYNAVRVKDHLCLSPLDHVCERIIMREERKRIIMRQERHRYHAKDKNKDDDATDLYLWECARLMLQTLGATTTSTTAVQLPVVVAVAEQQQQQQLMMMHACMQAGSLCPLALRQRVMKRYNHQLDTPDENGNLPLHIAASLSVAYYPDEEDSDVQEIQQQVLRACPSAIQAVNLKGKLPLDVAIDAGRTWSSGARILFEAFPEAIACQNMPIAHYPMLLSKIGPDSLYRVIKATPELFPGKKNDRVIPHE